MHHRPLTGWPELLKKRLITIRENSTFAAVPHPDQPLAESGVILESEFTHPEPHIPVSRPLPFRHVLTGVRFETAMFNLTGKITGHWQRYTRSVSSLSAARPIPQDRIPQDRPPDWVTEEQTSTGQALI
ncbi:hypothetical protein EDB89DRAFT_2245518 [Lactarius sanguifluus]|nr:hypothetical protein EDB89DRAFT_2245518 [Lactarius sanguifluus]